jgi:hypothetical protein
MNKEQRQTSVFMQQPLDRSAGTAGTELQDIE